MAYNQKLAERISTYLSNHTKQNITEKAMFSGLAFLVNDKMCVNVSEQNLMCRFDPDLQNEVAARAGFQPMIMKGRELKGYCLVSPEGYESEENFAYWVNLCLSFNDKAKSSKKRRR